MLVNPSAGYGRARAVADPLARALAGDGHAVTRLSIARGVATGVIDESEAPVSLRAALEGAPAGQDGRSRAGVLVVVGGDGTLHHAAGDAVAAATPIYHVPLGTENLFAREWRMDRRWATLRAALGAPAPRWADVGLCNGRPFLLMASVGLDASVVHRVAAARSRAVGHGAYVLPILRELADPCFPRVRVSVDGRTVVDGRAGLVVVGNSRQYALRLDPALHADPADGLLDVAFLPCATRLGMLAWALRRGLRRSIQHPRSLYQQGRHVRIDCLDGPQPVQVDGEAWPDPAGGVRSSSLDLTISPGVLGVLPGPAYVPSVSRTHAAEQPPCPAPSQAIAPNTLPTPTPTHAAGPTHPPGPLAAMPRA